MTFADRAPLYDRRDARVRLFAEVRVTDLIVSAWFVLRQAAPVVELLGQGL